ncbi:hypothetical protein B296_00056744 [Ensete ventricosum]|uniref:Uncharacterized protein n=1 Tax=Ensete ventricosum TaxID=4639 RepID=A0A426XU56_ENSVE|nr:hypothetical protein B296_00056744 [Ensete ventricosum]
MRSKRSRTVGSGTLTPVSMLSMATRFRFRFRFRLPTPRIGRPSVQTHAENTTLIATSVMNRPNRNSPLIPCRRLSHGNRSKMGNPGRRVWITGKVRRSMSNTCIGINPTIVGASPTTKYSAGKRTTTRSHSGPYGKISQHSAQGCYMSQNPVGSNAFDRSLRLLLHNEPNPNNYLKTKFHGTVVECEKLIPEQ